MIEVEGLNHKKFYLNEEQIEKIEEIPETVITLINDRKYLVKDTVDEVINKIIKFKNKIYVNGEYK